FILQRTGSTLDPVVANRNNLAAKTVEYREGGGVGMFGGQLRRTLFLRGACGLTRKPSVAPFFHRIVLVKRADVPGRELHPAIAAIGHFGTHRAAVGIVVHDRRDAFLLGFLVTVVGLAERIHAEIRLVLLDRLALVVEGGF